MIMSAIASAMTTFSNMTWVCPIHHACPPSCLTSTPSHIVLPPLRAIRECPEPRSAIFNPWHFKEQYATQDRVPDNIKDKAKQHRRTDEHQSLPGNRTVPDSGLVVGRPN